MDYSTVYPQYHSGDEDHHAAATYPAMYPPQMQPYPISNGPTPILQPEDMQALHARRLNSLSLHHHHQYHPDQAIAPLAAPFPTNSPPSPLSPFDPISPPISGSELSADAAYHSSGTGSPSSSRGTSLVHRHSMSMRYNPTASPSGSDHSHSRSRGRRGRQLPSHSPGDGSDGDEPINIAESMAASRKETTRRQRIEAEQRRRDDLRDGYARLKDALPSSTVKSSKVSLLDRATQHIQHLDQTTQALRARVMTLENEIQRLRAINETLLLSVSQNQHSTPGESGHVVDPVDRTGSVQGTPIPAPSPPTPHPDPSF